jgi:hypothetical protein
VLRGSAALLVGIGLGLQNLLVILFLNYPFARFLSAKVNDVIELNGMHR